MGGWACHAVRKAGDRLRTGPPRLAAAGYSVVAAGGARAAARARPAHIICHRIGIGALPQSRLAAEVRHGGLHGAGLQLLTASVAHACQLAHGGGAPPRRCRWVCGEGEEQEGLHWEHDGQAGRC